MSFGLNFEDEGAIFIDSLDTFLVGFIISQAFFDIIKPRRKEYIYRVNKLSYMKLSLVALTLPELYKQPTGISGYFLITVCKIGMSKLEIRVSFDSGS